MDVATKGHTESGWDVPEGHVRIPSGNSALKAWTNETHLSVVKAVESAEWLINLRVIFSIFIVAHS